ncbi:hypothetical protein CY34DRAFT_798671 [Suillus luteus UH-Slu-Lm8-n1]|uniref:Uncharacterized protein n=1 Tax=Suillus luteus UH-Slu-Lm8-n1 TaxID=930992 RepID=A0A0D0BE34_9AGAM|nr:hypothetical protein CY34DRAFT_798671 [Suillus luteus UH-Slu-Lm8-n1]
MGRYYLLQTLGRERAIIFIHLTFAQRILDQTATSTIATSDRKRCCMSPGFALVLRCSQQFFESPTRPWAHPQRWKTFDSMISVTETRKQTKSWLLPC